MGRPKGSRNVVRAKSDYKPEYADKLLEFFRHYSEGEEAGVPTLQRFAQSIGTYDVPAIILGDLNTAKGSDCYATLKNGTGYGDVADSFPNDYLADHIFYDPNGFSLKNAILEKGKKADTASDHWPMIADFSFLK